jgi:tetratricopeptide (TPR) repeat protein
MSRRLRNIALLLAIGLAATGAAVAYLLGGGRWAVVGAMIGAVSGAFAPSAYDGMVNRAARHEAWRAVAEKPPPQSWARLLDPRREVVRFLGRETELTALIDWCEDDQAGRLRLITGPGGVGKTRLSVELADRMRQLGWSSERVADGSEADVISRLRAVKRGRMLLIVDYAETRAGLAHLLTELASNKGEGVRVLLLARSAGDWWDRLGVAEPAVWDLVQAARPKLIELSPAVDADLSDAEVVALAVTAFARDLKLPERTVQISGTGRRRVLDLHAAALIAVLGEQEGQTVIVDSSQVLSELLRHEQHYWYDSARKFGLDAGQDGATPRSLRQVIVAACLLGAVNQPEACLLPGRIPGLSPSMKFADWLRVLYPPDPDGDEWIGSVQPDRLAELHVVRELADAPELANACLSGLEARQAVRAVTLLARASSDHSYAGELLRQILPNVANLIASMPVPAETLTVIYNAIPYTQEVLAEVLTTHQDEQESRELLKVILRLARTRPSENEEPIIEAAVAFAMTDGAQLGMETQVWAAVNLLDRPIHRDAALKLTDQITSQLANYSSTGTTANPWRLLLAFHVGQAGYPAISQQLLAPMISTGTIQQREAAMAVLYAIGGPRAETRLQIIISEAELVATSSDAEDDLLRLYSGLADAYDMLGDYRRALQHGQNALTLHRRLHGSDHHQTLNARALVGFWTGEVGDSAQALRLYRELLPDQERILGIGHADVLATRARIAGLTGRCGDSAQALRLYRELLPDQIRILGPDHPIVLATRGDIAGLSGRCGDSAQALRLYRELLPDQERVLGPDHPVVLATRGDIAAWTGEIGDSKEALRLYRELLPDQERVLGPDHPVVLATRGVVAAWTGETWDKKEALRLYRELLPDQERVLGPDHPVVLATRARIAILTDRCGDSAQALRLYRELLPDQERVLGIGHPNVLATRARIARLTDEEC